MKDKKKVAAMSAVLQYIRTDEEIACAQAMAEQAAEAPPVSPFRQINAWGASGRQSMMQIRGLMQLRAFRGSGCS